MFGKTRDINDTDTLDSSAIDGFFGDEAAAETSVEISRREVEVAQLRYQTGLSNNLDVVTAETGLLAAEGRRIQALADSAVARLRLRALLGVLNPRTDMPDSTATVPMSSNLAQ